MLNKQFDSSLWVDWNVSPPTNASMFLFRCSKHWSGMATWGSHHLVPSQQRKSEAPWYSSLVTCFSLYDDIFFLSHWGTQKVAGPQQPYRNLVSFLMESGRKRCHSHLLLTFYERSGLDFSDSIESKNNIFQSLIQLKISQTLLPLFFFFHFFKDDTNSTGQKLVSGKESKQYSSFFAYNHTFVKLKNSTR